MIDIQILYQNEVRKSKLHTLYLQFSECNITTTPIIQIQDCIGRYFLWKMSTLEWSVHKQALQTAE